jgi:hypothetical protein
MFTMAVVNPATIAQIAAASLKVKFSLLKAVSIIVKIVRYVLLWSIELLSIALMIVLLYFIRKDERILAV